MSVITYHGLKGNSLSMHFRGKEARCLIEIAAKMPEGNRKPVRDLALQHFKYSLPHVASGAYEGDHWLATYVVLALRSLGR